MRLGQLDHIPIVSVNEEAWGSDDEQGSVQPHSERHKPERLTPCAVPGPNSSQQASSRRAARHRTATSTAVSSAQTDQKFGAPPLQAICLGCLAEYTEELLEVGTGVLHFLPPDAKSALLAVARRQGLLTDAALKLLVDEGHDQLDLAGCPRITDAGLQVVLPRLANLQAVDLSQTSIGPATLRRLAECCPEVHTVRLGGSAAADDAAAAALKHIIPAVAPAVAAAEDSWEQLEEAEHTAGRLSHLQYVVWPTIPYKASELLRLRCPKVVLNPTGHVYLGLSAAKVKRNASLERAEAASGQGPFRAYKERKESLQAPQAADPSIALDQPYLDSIAQYTPPSDGLSQAEAELVPLAERFRMAYVSRERRLAAQAERNYQQQLRREARRNSAKQAISHWQTRLGHA